MLSKGTRVGGRGVDLVDDELLVVGLREPGAAAGAEGGLGRVGLRGRRTLAVAVVVVVDEEREEEAMAARARTGWMECMGFG